jgi:phosphoribosylformylglycinamidine cyclo-ligase
VKSITYKDAGVDIDKGNKVIHRIKKMVRSTYNEHVLTELGGFGGLYQFPKSKFENPVLVSSTDGVGTKLKIAFMLNKHDTVGEDLVNHCVNDIGVTGAYPLFFLDYFSSGKLEEHVFSEVISGFVRGCQNNKCALIGGETAEMPDMYQKGEYDLSGTIIGLVDKGNIIDGSMISKADVLVGVNSSGLHTNGYSLARRVLLEKIKIDHYVKDFGCTLGEELLKVHLSYLSVIQKAIHKFKINGISHITGGGIEGNTRRLLKKGILKIDWQAWERPGIFRMIQKLGNVPEEDMRRTFNLGIGLIFIVHRNLVDALCTMIKNLQYKCWIIGEIK